MFVMKTSVKAFKVLSEIAFACANSKQSKIKIDVKTEAARNIKIDANANFINVF